MTTKGTPGRMVRIDDEMWEAYGQLCAEEGTSRADDMRRHVHARVAAWRKEQGIEPPKKRVVIRRSKPKSD
ncbi:hypothetical protein ACFZBE_17890 [Streptomyces sp. NPDC008061]|jgi:hypothetical protein|uniref:hypothetical protein n=1 Tax=Streptomyces sp. NPDC008061 TaxID=3364805 RepID=UPI0036E22770